MTSQQDDDKLKDDKVNTPSQKLTVYKDTPDYNSPDFAGVYFPKATFQTEKGVTFQILRSQGPLDFGKLESKDSESVKSCKRTCDENTDMDIDEDSKEPSSKGARKGEYKSSLHDVVHKSKTDSQRKKDAKRCKKLSAKVISKLVSMGHIPNYVNTNVLRFNCAVRNETYFSDIRFCLPLGDNSLEEVNKFNVEWTVYIRGTSKHNICLSTSQLLAAIEENKNDRLYNRKVFDNVFVPKPKKTNKNKVSRSSYLSNIL